MAGLKTEGFSGVVAEVNADREQLVSLSNVPARVGGVRIFCEADAATNLLRSPRVSSDSQLIVGQDITLEHEQFNAVAQNTGKIAVLNTTMTAVFATGQVTTNGTSITTTTTGVLLRSWGTFPILGNATTVFEYTESFNAATPPTNTFIDIGPFNPGGTNPYAPTDGAVFRWVSGGAMSGLVFFNGGAEYATVSMPDFVATPNQKYQFRVSYTTSRVEFRINDVLVGSYDNTASGQIFAGLSLPWAQRHVISGGAAGGVFQCALSLVDVYLRGSSLAITPGMAGGVISGSHQGLTGGTMGSTALYANSANPTAAVPTNTTAALGSGLGGQFWETDTLAVTTDGIIQSFQVPAITQTGATRRIAIYGIRIFSFIQTVLAGGPYIAQWSLAIGHTAVSLATAEGAGSKAPRRIPLGAHAVTLNQAAGTMVPEFEPPRWDGAPLIVNPGEFIQTVRKKIGTTSTSGVVGHLISFDWAYVL